MTATPLNLFLVDEDPVFRMGLRIWLDQRPEFTVLGESAEGAEALTALAELQTRALENATDASRVDAPAMVDLVIIDIGLGQGQPQQMDGFNLCAAIKQQFPTLRVLVLSAQVEPVLKSAALQMGADGFGQRGLPLKALARLIQQTAQPSPESWQEAIGDVAVPQMPEGPIAFLNRTSLEQIEAEMAQIEQIASRRLPYWYRLVLAGKYRELRAARWLVQRILPVSQSPTPFTVSQRESGPAAPTIAASREVSPLASMARSQGELGQPSGGAIAPAASSLPVAVGDVQSRVCEAVFRKLQFPLTNRSDIPLEIDILREDKLRELFYILLRTFESLLDDLEQAQVLPGQLPDQRSIFLRDLWQAVMVDFFGRYYTPSVDGLEQPLVTVLQQDAEIVQSAILERIPEVSRLLSHLLFQTPMEIDGASYVATTPEALRRSQFLLENLVVQVGCAVMQPLLNRYPDVESLKRSLYQRRIISTRDITRFRNDLSWRYRWDTLVNEPKAIFESEYRLFALTPTGLRTHTVYAPRQEELESLSGLQYALTLALEARDAIAPRLRAVVSLAGSTVVFVLTEVIGRGIGLVGRGIVKGVGSTWQEIRFRQRSRDEP